MTDTIERELIDVMRLEAQRQFDVLIQNAQRYAANARVSTHSADFPDQSQVNLGILADPAGDEVAVEVALLSKEGGLWCELTLFVGQATTLTVAASCWEPSSRSGEEIADIIRSAFMLVGPRAERAFERCFSGSPVPPPP